MTPETYGFSSQDPDDPRGFAGYHRLYSGGSDVDRGDGPFHASVRAHRFERLLAFERYLDGVVHSRGPARVRKDGFDHLCVQVLLGGAMSGGRPGSERPLAPGELILFDMTQPQRTRHDRAHTITLGFPRELLERVAPIPRGLHGAVLPPAAGGLLADFAASLVRRSGRLAPGAAGSAGAVAAHLLAAALGQAGKPQRAGAVREQAEALRLERAQAYVDQHLGNPALDGTMVAEALGLSRSTLDRALRAEGGFSRFLLGRRLDRVRAALRRVEDVRTIGEVAYAHGFGSESYCSRAFRARFGVPPGEYRAEARRAGQSRHAAQARPGTLAHLFTEVL